MLRGEDLLPSTPRQIVLYDALKQIGVGSGRTSAFGHLPTVLGEGNRRLSKRDKGSGLAEYQQKGYLPEALLNYLALLGWGIAGGPRSSPSLKWWRPSTSDGSTPVPLVSMPRSVKRSMLRTSGCFPAELTENLVPFLAAAGLDQRAAAAGGARQLAPLRR